MPRIFITYRREDTSSQAGRVYDLLEDHYGREAIVDGYSIDPGRPWRRAIDTAVTSSDVVIALIGPQWLSELEARTGSDDYVRYELETALEKDRRVIPLLVNGAKMPTAEELPETLAGLTERRAFDVSDARFGPDMEELLRRLDRVVPPQMATELEVELTRWNWGAFLLTFVWGVGNGVMRSFLVLIPIYGFYEWFMLGIRGNRWAWEKRRWESLEQFHRSQRAWAAGGIIVVAIISLFLLASSGG